MQGKTVDKYKCNSCQKTFCNNNWLLQHQSICLEFIKEQHEIEKKALQQEIQALKNTIKELAEKAISNAKPVVNNNHNTTINNHIENLNVITEAHLQDQAKHLTIEHIKKGALGYSEYFLEHPLKDRVVCTDYSRRKLKYKNEQGEVVTDPELSKLSDLLFKSIKERNRELTIQYTNELTDKFKTATDPVQLSYFMEVASKFSQQDLEVFRMFNGDKNDFFHDILRNICSKTVVQ
jgi:flagellin-like hook-associated protein FlgL